MGEKWNSLYCSWIHILFSSCEIWKSIFTVLNQEGKEKNLPPLLHSLVQLSEDKKKKKKRRKLNRITSAEVSWAGFLPLGLFYIMKVWCSTCISKQRHFFKKTNRTISFGKRNEKSCYFRTYLFHNSRSEKRNRLIPHSCSLIPQTEGAVPWQCLFPWTMDEIWSHSGKHSKVCPDLGDSPSPRTINLWKTDRQTWRWWGSGIFMTTSYWLLATYKTVCHSSGLLLPPSKRHLHTTLSSHGTVKLLRAVSEMPTNQLPVTLKSTELTAR